MIAQLIEKPLRRNQISGAKSLREADSGEPGTIRAMTFAVVYEVGQAALAKLIRDRPSIADEIGVTLSQRAKVTTSGATSDHGVADASSISALVLRIRQLFEVPHGAFTAGFGAKGDA